MKNNLVKNMPDWSDKTILLVDDLKPIYDYFRFAMGKTGVHLLWAENGEKALQYIKNESSIDLVLMDIQMSGINGYETGKKVKMLRPDIPIIIQTAYFFEENEQKVLDNGLDGFITKPIRLNILIKLLTGFLH